MSKQDSAKNTNLQMKTLLLMALLYTNHFHALRDFDDIKGDYLGGYIKKEKTIP